MGGRIIVQAAAAAASATAAGVSNERQQAEFDPYISQNTLVGVMALLCAFISLAGLVSVIPWHRVWRSREDYLASRLANTGLKKNVLKAMPCVFYTKMRSQPNSVEECCICLAEFVEGERVRALPKCEHRFHMECVDKWLLSHSTCPTCRNCLVREEGWVEQIHVPTPPAGGGQAIFSVWEGGNNGGDIECGVRP